MTLMRMISGIKHPRMVVQEGMSSRIQDLLIVDEEIEKIYFKETLSTVSEAAI